jgi:D-glycero-D-manno-heptose 1,7-bisphosphate phosphatase
MINQALFLDRDGVINHDHGYVCKSEDFDFVEGIFDIARSAYEKNYKLVVITNQAGIGRGYYTEGDFHKLTGWMCDKFLEAGSPIDKVYFSPFHPLAGIGKYLKDDYSRKPHPGMILQAQEELKIDLGNSLLIGDKLSDVQAGEAAGVGTNLLLSSARNPEPDDLKYECIASLLEALPYIKNTIKSLDI